MNSSERRAAPPAGAGASQARFIPREELGGFSAWRPNALASDRNASGLPNLHGVRRNTAEHPPAAEVPASPQAAVQAARQSGYQDGYRDGLVALASFKQSLSLQMADRIESLVSGFDAAFEAMEAEIAAAVARTATALALQVVRSEVTQRPEMIARVANEAIEAVLLSARHIRVFANPEDVALIQAGAGEALTARNARLIADASVLRGGCRVESDVGRVDARIQTRWQDCARQLGQDLPYAQPSPPTQPPALSPAPSVVPDAAV